MITQSIRDFFGKFKGEEEYSSYNEEEYDDVQTEDYDYDNEEEEETTNHNIFQLSKYKSTKAKKIDVNSVRMRIVKPTSYEESREIILLLKQNQSVILNLDDINKEEAKRIIDTVSGGAIALNGRLAKISNLIFIATPENYIIEGDLKKRKSNLNFL